MHWWNLKQLRSRNPKARISALDKLDSEGDTSLIQAVTALLGDEAVAVRSAAAAALGRIGRAETVPSLATRLLKETDANTRKSIVKALHAISNPNAIPALAAVLTDPVGEVAWLAAKALQTLSWEPENDSERASWHLAVSQFEDAVSYGSAAIEPLIKLTQSTEFLRCIRAVESLAKVSGAQVVKPLLDALCHPDFTVRSAAATALGEVGDARATRPLINALHDANHQVCLAASISLGKMGDQSAVAPLIKVLAHSAPDVRSSAVAALGRLRDPQAVPPLVELLRDPDIETREGAAVALGSIGDERAIEPLVVLMMDHHNTVRQAAANALRRIEPYWERSEAAFRAIPALQASLKHREYWVRHSAADVLKKLGVSESRERKVLDSDGAMQNRQAAQAVLLEMLQDSDRAFRQAAAEALGRIGLSDAIALLVERLSDSDQGVRAAAARALENLRWQPTAPAEKARQLIALEKWAEASSLGPDAAEALAEVLHRRDGRAWKRALECLVQLGGAKALAALRAFASHPVRGARQEALAALAVVESSQPENSTSDAWSQFAALP